MVKREHLPASVGSLQLELRESSVLPGAALRGTVTLNIAELLESTLISVRIEAQERMAWSGSSQYSESLYKPVPRDEVTHTHLDTEFYLGNLNGSLAPGIHCLPFEFKLPPDLIPDSLVKDFLRKAIGNKRTVKVETLYSVSAKLEVAGLTNAQLKQKCPFEVLVPPIPTPLGSPVAASHTGNVKPLFGAAHPCTVHLQLVSDVVLFPSGTIEADVTIELPAKPKLHHVHLVLYEDDFVQNQFINGAQEESHPICRQTCSAKHFTASGSDKTVVGRIQLKVSDPDAEVYGDLVPSLTTRYVQIRHRVGVEVSFLLGSRVHVSVPVTLVRPTAPSA